MFSRYNNCDTETLPTYVNLTITGAGKSKRICLVSDSNDTYGQTGDDLATRLASDGWQVTFLDLSPNVTARLNKQSYEYVRLSGQYRERYWYTPLRSLCAYHWLRSKKFDAIVFQHDVGAGYFSCVARDLGLAFQNTFIAAFCGELHARALERHARFPTGRTDLERDFLERQTVERADALLTPDMAVAKWLNRTRWKLPAQFGCLAKESVDSDKAWGAWLASCQRKKLQKPRLKEEEIFISVCLTTYNRPEQLRAALASLEAQTYSNFEVVVIDDGSTDPGVDKLREELMPLFAKKKWRWEKQENSGPSKARNRIIELGRGTHLLFMDDDNIALADELEVFARAAQSGVDFLSCVSGWHEGSGFNLPPIMYLPSRQATGDDPLPVTWVPVGNCLPLTMFTNPFGDTNSLYRREAFEALGGFQGNREMVFEDFEFFTRAAIAGYKLEVIPEVLFLYCRHDESRSMGETIFTSHIESLRPVADLLPASLQPLLLPLRAGFYNQHRALIVRDKAKDGELYQLHKDVEFINMIEQLNKIPGFLELNEGYALMSLATNLPGTSAVVEIGSLKGRSTGFLAVGCRSSGRSHVYAVDHFSGSAEHQKGAHDEISEIAKNGTTLPEFNNNIQALGLAEYVTAIIGNSVESAQKWDKPIKLLFVDGDHSYEGTSSDYDAWFPFVEMGGIICMHDYHNPYYMDGVTKFIDDVLLKSSSVEYLTRVHSMMIFRKKHVNF